jgi:hypothetical protein
MPKASAPPIVGPIDLGPYLITLDETERSQIARALGLSRLPDDAATALQDAISIYRATLAHLLNTTPNSTIAAISDVQTISKRFAKVLRRFTDEGSGVDAETFDLLQPQATALVAALTLFATSAEQQETRLRGHERVYCDQECLRQLCAVLRKIFLQFAAQELRNGEKARGHLRKFALEVFEIAAIDHADFAIHPERLDELLRAEIAL